MNFSSGCMYTGAEKDRYLPVIGSQTVKFDVYGKHDGYAGWNRRTWPWRQSRV
jgi:hypothetical protein